MPCSRISRSIRSLLAGNPPPPQLHDHSRAAVCALECFMNGTNPRQHLCVCQPCGIGRAALLPCAIAIFAHRPTCVAPPSRRTNRMSPAQYAVAFLGFRCRFSRTFSARSRDGSICSGLTTVTPTPLSLPAAASLTQFRSALSVSTPWPPLGCQPVFNSRDC